MLDQRACTVLLCERSQLGSVVSSQCVCTILSKIISVEKRSTIIRSRVSRYDLYVSTSSLNVRNGDFEEIRTCLLVLARSEAERYQRCSYNCKNLFHTVFLILIK